VPELEEVVRAATAVRDAALTHLAGSGNGSAASQRLIVANAALTPRLLTVLLPGQDGEATISAPDGAALPAQPVEEGLLVHDSGRVVPGLGWLNLSMDPGAPGSAERGAAAVRAERLAGGVVLENEVLRIEIGEDGTLLHVVDKAAGDRDALAGRGNQLWVFVDKPRIYDAWDIEENYENEGSEVGGIEAIEVVETGPLRGAVRVSRTWRDSRIEQTYRLLSGSRRLDIASRSDWHDRQTYLQARFPLAVHSHEATYETLYGVTRRPTHRNTSWDAARYEVSGHRFADLSEPNYGVALLNDGKYGYSAHGNVLALSLLRSPLYPDPGADEGHHAFIYSLFPHPGDWTEGNVVSEAFVLNSPLIAVPAAGDGSQEGIDHFLALDGLPLSLGSLKRAEAGEGLILRLYEPHGNRGWATLRFPRPVQHVERVNLLEEAGVGYVPVLSDDGVTVQLDLRPFEVVSLRVGLSA
jgi:alpha-mannosidase